MWLTWYEYLILNDACVLSFCTKQVDPRLLRAVAIEHPKDADLAAGIVIAEVIPFMSKKLPAAIPPQHNDHGAPLDVEGADAYYVHSFLCNCTLFALNLFTDIFLMTCLICSWKWGGRQ